MRGHVGVSPVLLIYCQNAWAGRREEGWRLPRFPDWGEQGQRLVHWPDTAPR